MLTVKVVKVPGVVKEFSVEDGTTVGQVIALYGEETGSAVDGYELRIGDANVSTSQVLADGNKVYMVKQIKGNC